MMNRVWRRAMVRRTMMWVWAMLTVVLLVCVGLLARELVRQGNDPLALVRPEPKSVPAATATRTEPAANKEITLYFADAEGKALTPETTRIEASDSTVENCRRALEALIRGPRDILTPILPPSARIRGIYMLKGGGLVVDFSIEFAQELRKVRSASVESLLVYGIVDTLAKDELRGPQDEGVANVRFLIEGSVPRDNFPAHLELGDPIKPDSRWIAGGGA